MLGLPRGESDLDSIDAFSVKTIEQTGLFGMDENEKAAGGLGIEKDVLYLRRDRIGNVDTASQKFAVPGKAAGAKTFAAVLARARQQRQLAVIDLNGDAARFRHLAGVSHQAKSSDVG